MTSELVLATTINRLQSMQTKVHKVHTMSVQTTTTCLQTLAQMLNILKPRFCLQGKLQNEQRQFQFVQIRYDQGLTAHMQCMC